MIDWSCCGLWNSSNYRPTGIMKYLLRLFFFFIKHSSYKFLIICQLVSPNNTVFNYFSQTFSNIFWELVHEFRISSVINLRVLRNFYWFDLLDVPPIWTLVISENIQPCKIEVKLRVMEEGGARVAALELTST